MLGDGHLRKPYLLVEHDGACVHIEGDGLRVLGSVLRRFVRKCKFTVEVVRAVERKRRGAVESLATRARRALI